MLVVVLGLAIGSTQWGGTGQRTTTDTKDARPSSSSRTGVLPFEIVGVLLLAAVIGGIFLAKRDRSATDDGE